MAARSSTPTSQRSVPYCSVPPGHIIVSDRLVGQPLHEALKGEHVYTAARCVLNVEWLEQLTSHNVDEGMKLIVEGSLHFVDCYPSSSCGVVYLDQGAVISEDKTTKRKLEKVSKVAMQDWKHVAVVLN